MLNLRPAIPDIASVMMAGSDTNQDDLRAAQYLAWAVQALFEGRVLDADNLYASGRSTRPDTFPFSLYPTIRHFARSMATEGMRAGDFEGSGRWGRVARAGQIAMASDQGGTLIGLGPYWTGEPVRGRKLLILERGYGDVIQYCRFSPGLVAAGADVTFACPKSLWPLLWTLEPSMGLIEIPWSDRRAEVEKFDLVPDCDYVCDHIILPGLLGLRPETIPTPAGYLKADPDRVEHWRSILPVGPKVGLVWGGGLGNAWDPIRSIPPGTVADTLAPILQVPGVTFVSMQVGARSGEAASLPGVIDVTPQLTDFGETAALIANLDLTIAIESSVAHLAGALGRPVWIMLAAPTCWRWMMGRTDSPWYTSARLFRQTASGEWGTVVADMASALRQRFQSQRPSAGTLPDGKASTLNLGETTTAELDQMATMN